jgi:cytochrome c-type biogenesis protein CcmH
MLLPLALALVTAMALVIVIAPLMLASRGAPARLDYDRAVYRDQLKELERDLARGVIGAAEAETARLEIERRLLAADRADQAPAREARALPRLGWVLALVLAGGAGGLYLALGAPGVPDFPHDSQHAAAPGAAAPLQKTAADLEQQLKQNPGDADGWADLGRTEADLKDWQKAADAYGKAAKLAPARSDIAAAYGETLVLAADGVVTPAAAAQFRAVVTADPKSGIARYYLALADAQAGRTDAAIAAWQKLEAEAPANAPIRAEIERRIAEAAKSAGIAPPAAPAGAPGPNAAQIEDAAKMSPAERDNMVRAMVERLATQLQKEPSDLDGWKRLARAYGVLGERDKAADAWEHAATLDPKDVDNPLGEIDALLAGNALDQPMPDRVVALLHKVEGMSPDEPEALWYLGLVAAQTKKPDEARRYWQRLLDKLPADAPERKTVSDALASLPAAK